MKKINGITVVPKKSTTELTTKFDLINDWDDDDSYCSIEINKGHSKFVFKLRIMRDEFCCGLRSVGDFGISNTAGITEEQKIEGVKQLFNRLLDVVKDGNKEITLQFTLVKNSACDLVGAALKDGKMFTKVKTFINRNGGRTNDLYVSN